MATLREWISRVRAMIHPGRTDRELEEELRLHLELAAEDARRRDLPGGAARAATIRAGGLAQALDAMRDQRGLPWLDDLARDVRHAFRLLRRNPGFAAIAVVSLALGVGANSAMFSLADELILRPLPIHDPAAVVTVSTDAPGQGFMGGGVSYPNYRDLRQSARSFDGLLAYQGFTVSFARSPRDVREMRRGMLVSDNYFAVLGVRPELGRGFTPGEGRVPGRDAVVVLSHDFWENELGGDASILNTVVWMNGIDFRVIGVAPASFTGLDPPFRPAFYAPIMMAQRLGGTPENQLEMRQVVAFAVHGRLRSGVSKSGAQAEAATLWRALQQHYPDANRNRTMAVRTELEERIRQDPWDTVLLVILAALAAVVLTIACTNVANLLLGRGRARAHEMAIRLALGVSRSRLLRQMLTESFVLALAGFALGLGVAFGGIRFLQTIPTGNQIVIAPQLDGRALLFGLVLAVVSALLFGLAPARQGLETGVVQALKTSDLADASRQRILGRNLLVIAQVALSMVLLLATGMLVDAFRKAITLDPGFRTDHLMMLSLDTSLVRYTPQQSRAFYRDLTLRAGALPGVTSVALTSSVPFLVGDQDTEDVVPEGYQFPRGQDHVSTFCAVVDERYFGTMRIALTRGRGFTAGDTDVSRRVVVVNEEFAKRYWPGRDPIGRRVGLAGASGAWPEVVGLAKTGKHMWIGEEPTPFLYLPSTQRERTHFSLLVETRNADPAPLAGPLRDVVRTLDVNQPVFNVQTLSKLYRERAIAVPLIIIQLVGAMGLLGLTLALIGLYGVVAYSVARRTRELGIRMAIGAGRSDVLRMVLRQGLSLSLAGILLGGVASVAVARLLAAALAGVGTPSPLTYVIVPVALICMTVAASYFPARRASRVDPLVALRYE